MTGAPLSDIEAEQWKLRGDVEVVRRYGEVHPDEFVEVRFENEPSVRLVVLMSGGHPRRHAEALGDLVRYPQQLEVRPSTYSLARLEEIRDEVRDAAIARGGGALQQVGIGLGRVEVRLGADQEDLARHLHERYEDAIELTVGVLPYPLAPGLDEVDGSDRRPPRVRPPLLPAGELAVDADGALVVQSGRTGRGSLRVSNRGPADVVIETNGVLTASVVDPTTGEVIGGFAGFQTVPLVTFVAPSGGEVSIPLLIGTTSVVARLGYSVPPGEWAIEVPVRIAGRGQFRTPLLALHVGAVAD